MKHKIGMIAICALLCLLLSACVTSVDPALPYAQLPEIIVATPFNLVASPSHPTAYLAGDPIPSGAKVQVIGSDKNAAWLLVLHDNQVGWMPTFYSRTNVGALKPAIMVDPLSDKCTKYLGATKAPDAAWTSDMAGTVIVQGSIYRSQTDAAFDAATLALQVTGEGKATAADYVHTPLTSSSALILFTFAVEHVAQGSHITFALTNPTNEPLTFQAAFFSHSCPEALRTVSSQFTDQLSIGKTKLVASQQTAPTPANAATPQAGSTTEPTHAPSGGPQGKVLAAILSARAGPDFTYPQTGEKLRDEPFALLKRVCGAPGGYDWFLIATNQGEEQWLPGAAGLVAVENADLLPCAVPPPTPTPAVSTVTVKTVNEAGSKTITATQALAEYAFAIGRYRLAEKAAFALPNSPAVSQLHDYAHGPALTTALDTVRQLRTQRLAATLTLTQLTVKFAILLNDGTVGVLVDEHHSLMTRRPLATGEQAVNTEEFAGPVLYNIGYQGGQWSIGSITPLGDTNSGGGSPDRGGANQPDHTSALKSIESLLSETEKAGTIVNPPPPIDTSTFTHPEKTTIQGRITQNMLLEQAAGPYVIQGEVSVDPNIILFIEPGTIVKFADDAYLTVNGSLIAQGTKDQPIIFTSIKDDLAGGDTNTDGGASAPAPGDWTYIGFKDQSKDANSIIEHAIIRYAGEYRGQRFGAIYLEAASPTILNNTIEDAFWYAISADVNSFPVVAGNQTQNNPGNGLEVRDGDMTTNGAWRNLDMPYVILGHVTVHDGATLSIDPGVIIKLGNDAYFDVNGAFRAVGSVDDKITFTSLRDDTVGGDTNGDQASSAPAPGDWTYISFKDQSNDANTIIQNAIIRYAGEYRRQPSGAIHLEGASPTISNTLIENSFWYAISADVNSFPKTHGNQLLHNAGNGLEIRPGTLTVNGVWRNIDIPYVVLGAIQVKDGAVLTLAPGVIVKFSNDAYFDIFGAFKAIGTTDKKITFTSIKDDSVGGDTNNDETSTTPAAGDWTYIGFKESSNDANSVLEQVVIRYAGEYQGRNYGAIHLEAASPTIANNTIEDSFWYAISADLNSFPTIHANQLANNAGNGLEIRAGTVTINGVWRNTDIPYVILQTIAINQNAMLTLAPGVVVKLADNALFEVNGAFKAIGTAEKPITFTSLRDDAVGGDTNGDQATTTPAPGDWTTIRFHNTSNNTNSVIQYAVLRYAGKNNGTPFGAISLEGASPTIMNNTIEDSFAYGIWYDARSTPKLSDNNFKDNGQEDVMQAK